ncbi:MAG TPA: NADH-quinone oxidoreductase subunit NuoK [Candidatus Nitrosotenuis sp.]|jgi:NADH-quinone oxidoreductase subunit K|nr:NADH-quinone oxidoreductase subunit NuoK [Candidatus Nitrosotenuis sp.]
MTGPITLQHYLLLGAALFCVGVYGVLTRRNAIGVLMALELMFNASNVNLVAFSRFYPDITGLTCSLFVIAVAAAEAAVGVAIVLSVYRNFQHIDLEQVDTMKG